jgi:hypothetical protein
MHEILLTAPKRGVGSTFQTRLVGAWHPQHIYLVETSPLHPLRLGEFFVYLASKKQMAMSSQRLIEDCNDEGSSDTASDTNEYNTLRFKHGSYPKATYHFIHIGFIILNLCLLITLFMLVLPQDGKGMNQASCLIPSPSIHCHESWY